VVKMILLTNANPPDRCARSQRPEHKGFTEPIGANRFGRPAVIKSPPICSGSDCAGPVRARRRKEIVVILCSRIVPPDGPAASDGVLDQVQHDPCNSWSLIAARPAAANGS